MNYLAFDTSGKALIVILSSDGRLYTHNDPDCGIRHSEELMPRIEELFEKAGTGADKLDYIACGVGAGSFTGIRIAVSTAKALCMAFGKPCLKITSFDMLAYNKKGKVTAVIDAGHGGFYACRYDDFIPAEQPRYILAEELVSICADYPAVSDGVISAVQSEKVDRLEGFIKAAEMKADEVSSDPESLEPLYIRKSQAEEGR